MVTLNTVTQLLLFVALAILVNFLHFKILLALFMLLMLLMYICKNQAVYLKVIFKATVRFKWFFIFMFVIFAFNTPGEHVRGWPFSASPSYEGLILGAKQALKIILVLASLSFMLAINTKQQFISALYILLSPLRHLGLKVERFAARLWLTLHYVEHQNEANNTHNFISQIQKIASVEEIPIDEEAHIHLILPHYTIADFVVIALLMIAVFLVVKF